MLARFTILALLPLLAGGALAQEREWQFDSGDREAYLSFGVPESDDVGLSFWCVLHSGKIALFMPEAGAGIEPGAPAELTVGAGGKTFAYPAKTAVNEESGGTSAEAEIAGGDPLFAALRQADRFTVTAGGEAQNFPLEGADIGGLERLCGKD